MTDRIAHYEESLLKLELHLENLRACETFEHFKACQVAFVAILVAEQQERLLKEKADRIAELAAQVFLRDTEFVTKIRDAVGKITETQQGLKAQWQVAANLIPPTPCRLLIPERGHCATCDEIYAERDTEEAKHWLPDDVPEVLTAKGLGGVPATPPARIDDAQPYDPVRQERAERRFPEVKP